MLGPESQLLTFEHEGPKARRVRAQASMLGSDVFAGSTHQVPMLALRSRAPVPPGLRIEMNFSTGAGSSVDLLGVSRSYMPDGSGNYRIEVMIAPTHRHRISVLRAYALPLQADAPIEVQRERTGPRPSRAPTRGLSYPPASHAPSSEPADSNPNLPMRLRVRGGDGLMGALRESPDRRDGGTLRLPVRREARIGRTVLIEVGLGPMVDEVVLAGVIIEARSHGPGQTDAVIRVVPSHRHRVAYLAQVLRGQREPTARALPRYDMKLKASILRYPRTLPAAVQSVSEAGVFVRSYVEAEVGSTVDLEIDLKERGPVRLAADVVWQSTDNDRVGFGATFAGGQAALVQRIKDFISTLNPPLEASVAPG